MYMQKITPFIWFEKDALKAAEFYVSVFGEDSRITNSSIMTDTPSGTVEIITVSLRAQTFTLMSAGPYEKLNSAVSFVINVSGQAEVDYFWNALSAVPAAERCGWLKDKFGVTWQVVPKELYELLANPDKAKASRAQKAMLTMKKIIIAELE
jgi:predicted 3-demethylubiquinone-9 3-methyltransferase (glyoxalase superfamily)